MYEKKEGRVVEITPTQEAPDNKYRFVPNAMKDEKYRLTRIPMHAGQRPESAEIYLSDYANKQVSIEGDFNIGDDWVWQAQDPVLL